MDQALKRPGNASAWEALVRFLAHSRDPTRTGWEAATAEARRAVEIDPNDGIAHAALALAQGQLWRLRGGDDPELAQQIVNGVRCARALAPDDPGVLAFSAWALACLRKLHDALPLAERAVRLSSGPDARAVLGAILARLGRSDEALVELDALERAMPDGPTLYYSSNWRALALLRAGRLEQALEVAEGAVGLRPGPEALLLSMLCLAKLNRWDRACDALSRLRDADPDMSRAAVESLVRDFCDEADADEYLGIARRVWDEATGGPS
jgi:tetratricopeptide (TPR) repeat protein